MNSVERFSELMCCGTVEQWRDKLFSIGSGLGYDKTLVAIFPDRDTPVRIEHAFLYHSYSSEWLNKYDDEKMYLVDPTVIHCATRSTPLIWSPEVFSEPKQRVLYEEASSYGLGSGVTLPIHGANGEFGILCFVSDCRPDKQFDRKVQSGLAALSCLRDFILESAGAFMKSRLPKADVPRISNRELECLKWAAMGKSSWEIGRILSCAEATVNFHFTNIRRKLNSRSRQQAVVKAIKMDLIHPL